MDRYNERLISGKASMGAILGLVGAIILTVIGAGLFLFTPPIGVLILVVGIALIVFAKDGLSVEYEYIITNGDIEIAKILSKKKRKGVANIESEKINRMERADNDRVKNDISLGKYKVKSFVGKESSENEIAIFVGEGDNQEIYVLDFDDKCIDHMNQVLKLKSNVK
ncbi:MAG: DUF6106 family protein [Eubacterium sp.]|nr:DUF6106 family protein [Eubacterium sp.]